MKLKLAILSIFLTAIIFQARAQCHIDDFNALRAFALSTNANSWTINTGWDLVLNNANPPGGCDLSTMLGVTTDGTRVTRLELMENNLTGTLPMQIGDLTSLIVLNLGDSTDSPGNEIGGGIPKTIGQLLVLQQLSFSSNNLSNTIPTEIGDLAQLRSLVLANNNLTGAIPTQIGDLTLVNFISLDNNNLSGAIPSTIGNLVHMHTLSLSGNLLTSLPNEIGDCTNLLSLYLSNNNFTTELPSGLVDCPGLIRLVATNYSNLGPRAIPSVIEDMIELQYLILTHNEYTGTIPTSFNNLTNLLWLQLNNNSLTGDIPPILSYPNLQILYLNSNNFTGGLPNNIGNLSDLFVLILHSNPNLGGQLPSSLGSLSNMYLFQAFNCGFTGAIPSELQNWTTAIQIQLSNNLLTGDIPDMFTNLDDLGILYVHGNQLTGPIPPSLGDQPGIIANFSNNNMSGCFDINLLNLCDTPSVIATSGNMFDTTWTAFCASTEGVCPYGITDYCEFDNGLPTMIDIEGNACIQGVINAGEAVQLTPLNAAPTDPAIGLMYFDASTNKLRVWDGTSWRDCW